ncbi:hypothetical protein GPECTOR_32g455 [Gonium pectorale]|uniref:Uncharacterized protein n=1 Tax=Gonium pectorale TaxID=33097 RepID=A0A150GDJ2_GONPE|nr:hypothetical protein GPECTOR_32g455 [Gonium pectorale]|eukprot:KXZ47843.1 hypothetical protein GPECTOR_32g455 [Gonium pectorale]
MEPATAGPSVGAVSVNTAAVSGASTGTTQLVNSVSSFIDNHFYELRRGGAASWMRCSCSLCLWRLTHRSNTRTRFLGIRTDLRVQHNINIEELGGELIDLVSDPSSSG